MASLNRILLVAGRHLRENPYREVRIKHLFEAQGIEVTLGIPGRGLNKGGFLREAFEDPVFQREGACLIDGEWDFRRVMRGCQGVVLSTWRSYDPLSAMARHAGLPSINFSATGGMDFWPNGVDHCLVRSAMAIRLLEYFETTGGAVACVPVNRMIIVGSALHEALDRHEPIADRETFCLRYGMDPSRRIVTLFPAGVHPYRVKLGRWHPEWSPGQIDDYVARMVGEYLEICRQILDAGCNLLIKLHPAAYVGYWCQEGEEVDFWHRHVDARILVPEDTRLMYAHMDIGVGINTTSSMDTGYFNKPFIYVNPETFKFDFPFLDHTRIEACCGIPLGPSSHWHTRPQCSPTPWMPSWLGHFSRVEGLGALLRDPRTFVLDPEHVRVYIEEFWYRNDNRTGERIVAATRSRFEEALSHSSMGMKLRRLRHSLQPGSLRQRWRGKSPVA
ncbi:MAG: hypothetical protein HQL76_02010 [Magnetococcales bacterium]|nr:hypothetical protein [Magnetococcales bacterium]